ncbi:MAG: AzlC family ABC transporter permease, partial [Lachnospiraceae bacterium]|nr:AzlC family ABC transporter permease [Lachnospiraceae bacterium]
MNQDLRRGARAGVPIALGYLSVSFTFGLVAVSAGLAPLQACLISMTCLTSAGQFAGLDIMVLRGGLIEMALAQLIINLRYSLMTISLSQKTDDTFSFPVRLLTSFGVTDEIFAVSMAKNETISKHYMAGIIGVAYLGWAFGTLAGALFGNILPGVVVDALGIAIYGMFLAIIIPPAREDRKLLRVILI